MKGPVCGHMCEGLERFQWSALTEGERPVYITGQGCIATEDTWVSVVLHYCPWCAVQLPCAACGEFPPHDHCTNCFKQVCEEHDIWCDIQEECPTNDGSGVLPAIQAQRAGRR